MYATSGTKDNPHKYTSQILDDNTNLYYYNARYYDPTLGVFITADSKVRNIYDPQNLNRYTYCRDNPIRYIDPSGHDIITALIGAVVGYVVGGTHGFTKGELIIDPSRGHYEIKGFDNDAAVQGAVIGFTMGLLFPTPTAFKTSMSFMTIGAHSAAITAKDLGYSEDDPETKNMVMYGMIFGGLLGGLLGQHCESIDKEAGKPIEYTRNGEKVKDIGISGGAAEFYKGILDILGGYASYAFRGGKLRVNDFIFWYPQN